MCAYRGVLEILRSEEVGGELVRPLLVRVDAHLLPQRSYILEGDRGMRVALRWNQFIVGPHRRLYRVTGVRG